MLLGDRVPSNEGEKGHRLKRCFFADIGWSSMKMVAVRHRYAAYHNKHWRQAT